MKEVITSRILRTILLLIAVCFLSISAQAQYGGGNGTTDSAETNTYVFLLGQSTVVQTGGFAGVHETYGIEGEFQLRIDHDAGIASFEKVYANLTEPSSFLYTQSLGELFNMTSLLGTFLDDTTISFTGKADDGSDVLITVTIEDELAYLVGQTTPPSNTADFFLFSLDAAAQKKYGKTSTHVFLSDQSTVVKTGGFAGVHETYPIQGQFQLTVDANAGAASFDYVDAFLLSPISSSPPQSLGELFNMTELQGAVLDDTTVSFTGKADDGSDVLITLTIEDDLAYLVGETIPPPNTADFFLFSLDAVAQRKYGGGSGEPNDPYLIYTAEQMNTIGLHEEDWDEHFKLMADIDLSGYTETEFNIIGISFWDFNHIGPIRIKIPFTGTFDGNGHTISNFTYVWIEAEDTGIFGYVNAPNAQIRDLGLIDPNVDAGVGDRVGSLVGCLERGTITNCYVKGGRVSADNKVGGLVGLNGGTITNCCASASILGYSSVGGLVGWNDGTITDCYSTGSVTGTTDVGGLVGWNHDIITNCYSTGSVLGNDDVGGLVGLHIAGTVTGCFWDIETSGQSTSTGGTGKATAEMQMESTFTDAGWDFVAESVNGIEDIWSICEGTNYPRLAWQIPAGDFVCPDGIAIEDFVFFIDHWLDDNCDISNDYCQGTDLDFSGTVDANDLEIFFENWLESVRSD